MITIQDSARFSGLLWPQFFTVQDAVFLECECHGEIVTPERLRALAATEVGLQDEEWFTNYVHLFDVISHEAPLFQLGDNPDEYDVAHPDFLAAWMLSKQIARAWCGKLAVEFPEYCFVVVATKLSDPIVRFYKRRPVDMFGDVLAHFANSTQKDEAFVQFSREYRP